MPPLLRRNRTPQQFLIGTVSQRPMVGGPHRPAFHPLASSDVSSNRKNYLLFVPNNKNLDLNFQNFLLENELGVPTYLS